MRILCDQNVAAKYVTAFEQADGITVTTVAEALAADATDSEIAVYATTNDWVVFTTDDDFYTDAFDHGLLLYDQLDDPSPGDVLAAVRCIESSYETTGDIVEYVPDGWV